MAVIWIARDKTKAFDGYSWNHAKMKEPEGETWGGFDFDHLLARKLKLGLSRGEQKRFKMIMEPL